MKTNDDHGDRMRRYLLGELPEPEADELELALLSDRKDLFLLAEAVEADLLVDYVQDRLTPAERERLESGVLATPGGRDRLALTRALAPRPGRVLLFWRRTVQTVTAVPARHRKAVAAAAVALVTVGVWVAQQQPSPPLSGSPEHDSGVETAVSPIPTLSPSPAPDPGAATGGITPAPAPVATQTPEPLKPVLLKPVVVTLVDATRGDDSALIAEIGPGNGEVEIQLPVTYEPYETFRFTVRNAADDTVVTQQEVAAGPVDREGMRIASLILSAASLPDGNYVIGVWGLKAGEEPVLIVEPNLKVVRTR